MRRKVKEKRKKSNYADVCMQRSEGGEISSLAPKVSRRLNRAAIFLKSRVTFSSSREKGGEEGKVNETREIAVGEKRSREIRKRRTQARRVEEVDCVSPSH